jgi:hypothetical protein
MNNPQQAARYPKIKIGIHRFTDLMQSQKICESVFKPCVIRFVKINLHIFARMTQEQLRDIRERTDALRRHL